MVNKKPIQWFLFQNKKKEEVKPEIWMWEAFYSDGSSLKQFSDDGVFHQFKEINQEKLAIFKVYSSHYPHDFTLFFEKGMKLIYFYQRYCFNANSSLEKKFTIYCFGYQKKKEKKIFMIMPNGGLVITNDAENVKFLS